jgi:DNA (cytosine-5)-methyltransferase 1
MAQEETETVSRWGRYDAVIRRWEAVLGRSAPEPTEPGKDGKPRLSPRFAEWMMALPEGWVTDAGISRKDQLRCIGNGVVAPQCALAVRILLSGMETG